MIIMNRHSHILVDHERETRAREDNVLFPSEIRLISEGISEELADFALSSRLNASDPEGNTPLHLAARIGNIAVCDLLIRSGANPALLNYKRQSPVEVAFAEGQILSAQFLSSLVTSAPESKAISKSEYSSLIRSPLTVRDADRENKFPLVKHTVTHDAPKDIDVLSSFEAEVDPEEFFEKYKSKAASGTFEVLVSSTPSVSIENDGDWYLDLSPRQIIREAIGSETSILPSHGEAQDFLKVSKGGRKSVKQAVIQNGMRLSINPQICITWAKQILAKGRCSFDDVDRLVANCEGDGDIEDLRVNLHRIMEVAGFDIEHVCGITEGLWDTRSDVTSDELSDAIQAALTRATRLPGTQRFVINKTKELQLLEPMIQAKQELHLGILGSKNAVEKILNVFDSIRNGKRDPCSVSLRTIIPSRFEHSETDEVMAARELLQSWHNNGRVMDGKQRRTAIAALEKLDLSLSFYKELVCSLKNERHSVDSSIHLEEMISVYEAASELLVLKHLPYARRFASRNVEEDEDPEDVFQVACIGLQRSTRRFDPDRGIRFIIYCTYWMKQALTRWRADESALIRVPVHRHEELAKLDQALEKLGVRAKGRVSDNDLAAELELSAHQVKQLRSVPREAVYPDSIDNWDAMMPELEGSNYLDQTETEKIVADALAELNHRQADVIRRRFGIGYETNMTLEEIGEIYGVTRERIRQIEAVALKRLAQPSRKRRIHELLGM